MAIEFESITKFGPEEAADLFDRAFADYFVRLPFTPATLWHMARVDSVSLADSCVALDDGRAVGVALIARRGWTCRLAAMGLLPEARRRGVGRALVTHLLAGARTRGDRRMVLEVIEQNPAAVRLYEATGFARVRRLVGLVGTGSPPADDLPEPAEVDVRTVARHISHHTGDDWPWQISGESVAQHTPPARGFGMEDAWVTVRGLDGPQVSLLGLTASAGPERARRASRLIRALMARHPGKTWRISAYWPEELADWFEPAWFTRQELTQWQMARAV